MRTFFFLLFLLVLIGCSTNNGNTVIVPAAPTNLAATVISTTQVNLAWTDNSTNETGYKIQRKTVGGNFADIASTGPDMTSFSDVGLTPNTTFTYRVYAYNSAGNSLQYSNEVTVTTNSSSQTYSYTAGPNVTDIDGNVYPSITTSCGQTWTAKNLNVSHYRNGDTIPQVTDPTVWANLTTGAWCYYNNDLTNGTIYGKLYNWYAVNDPRGIAPQGWHMPTDAEWNSLIKCIDPLADTTCLDCSQSSTAGGSMKTTVGWNNPNSGATNSSGFAGLPGGFREGAFFSDLGNYGMWWNANKYSLTSAMYRSIDNSSAFIARDYHDTSGGFSVRIIKD